MVQIEGAHIGIARGLAHFDELHDVRMVDRKVRHVRAAARGALAVGQAGRVVDLEVRHDAHALFIGIADTDVNAHAAAEHRKPVDFRERVHKTLGRVGHVAHKARDRQTALVAAEAQNRRRKAQPVLAGVVVDALRVLGIAGKVLGNIGVALLRGLFPFAHIAFAQTLHAQLVEEFVAGKINLNGHS